MASDIPSSMLPKEPSPEQIRRRESLEREVEAFRKGKEKANEEWRERVSTPLPIVPTSLDREPGVCQQCGQDFLAMVSRVDGQTVLRAMVCEPCVESARAASEQDAQRAREAGREASWELICPIDYRETDLARLVAGMRAKTKPCRMVGGKKVFLPVEELVGLVTNWDSKSTRGIGLIGPSGHFKSRLIFQLLHRLHFQDGFEIRYLNAVYFADDLAASYSNNAKEANQWLERLCRVPILFIDDLGKERCTDRVEAGLYRVTEERRAKRRRTFFTCNQSGEELIGRMTQDRGLPIVNRLREMCDSFLTV